METIDPRISRWLERNNRLATAFHARVLADIAFYEGKPEAVPLERAGTALLLTYYHGDRYPIKKDALSMADAKAREAIKALGEDEKDCYRKQEEIQGDFFRRMTSLLPVTHHMTYPRGNNELDFIVFQCNAEVENETGIPRFVIADPAMDDPVRIKIIERRLMKRRSTDGSDEITSWGWGKTIEPDLSGIFDNASHHIETIRLNPGTEYKAFYFQGIGATGRGIVTSRDPKGRPAIGPVTPERT